MKRPEIGPILGTLLVMAACLGVGTVRAETPEPPAQVEPPVLGARSAILVDANSGAILFEQNARAEYAPASLTKMVTALVAVERAPLDLMVRSTHRFDVVPVVIGMEPGDSLTLEAALHGLMLNSGNDVAVAIAEAVADGSSQKFVGWMNDLTPRLGLTHSRFKNPHGLDQDGHVSSAYDMAIVGRALMLQPTLARIVGQSRYEVEGPPRWVFHATNPLLGIYPGVDGIKTGFDDNAGRCLVATAVRGERRAIAVVMDSPNTGAEAAALLDYAFEDTRWGRIAAAGAERRSIDPPVAMLRADLQTGGADVPSSIARAARIVHDVVSRTLP